MSERAKNNPPREQDAVYTTIVGGRPPGCGTEIGPIPRGLEVLVKKASVDDEFKALLLERRAGAAREIGLELDPAEAAMLGVIPRAQLEATVARTRVAPENRRVFLGQAAALMLAALGGSLLAGCKSEPGAETATPKLTPTKAPPPVQTPTAVKVAGVRAERPIRSAGQTIERPARVEIFDGIRPIRPQEENPVMSRMRGIRPIRPNQPPMVESAGVQIERPEQPPMIDSADTRAPQPEPPPVTIHGARIQRPVRGTRPARPVKPDESVTVLGVRPAPKKEE